MSKKQLAAMLCLTLSGWLAGLVVVLVALLTIPFGVGLVLFFEMGSWINYLYPFGHAGVMLGKYPRYLLPEHVGLAADIGMWLLLGFGYSFIGRRLGRRDMVMLAIALVPVIGILIRMIFLLTGLELAYEHPRM